MLTKSITAALILGPDPESDGNIYRPENIDSFRQFVLDNTEGKGVHFFMADGVSFCFYSVHFGIVLVFSQSYGKSSRAGLLGGGPGEHPGGALEAALLVPADGGARHPARRRPLRVQTVRPVHAVRGRPRVPRIARLPPRRALQAAHLAAGQLGEVLQLDFKYIMGYLHVFFCIGFSRTI